MDTDEIPEKTLSHAEEGRSEVEVGRFTMDDWH